MQHMKRPDNRDLLGLGAAALIVPIAILVVVYALSGTPTSPPMAAPERPIRTIDVLPGDVTIARGSDQTITAQLLGFDSGEVSLLMRTSESAPFERVSMIPQEGEEAVPGGFETLLSDVREETSYLVGSFAGPFAVRSDVFTIEVIGL